MSAAAPTAASEAESATFRSETSHFLCEASRAVVNEQIVARFNQVARHSRSHTPETDKSDFHDVTLLVGPIKSCCRGGGQNPFYEIDLEGFSY
jgi:hypothetical protein